MRCCRRRPLLSPQASSRYDGRAVPPVWSHASGRGWDITDAPYRGPRRGGGLAPRGVIGSLTHDARVAMAAVGRSCDVGAIGIDVEPAEPLPTELLDMV